jgi:tetratricopeptide (TPR) repeat protein
MKKIQSTIFLAGLLVVLYVIFNLTHLTWKFVSPEGIWSFWLFVDVLRIVFISIILLIGILVFVFFFFSTIIESIKNGFQLKSFKTLFLALVGLIVSIGLNVLFGLGPSISITKRMSEKYSYINKSNSLIDQGEYQEALSEAESAYGKMQEDKLEIHPFFFLAHFAQKKGLVLNSPLEEKYAVIVNYAYCLLNIRKDLDRAKSLFEESIQLVDSEKNLNRKEFKIFPLIQIADIHLQRRNFEEAEGLFQEIKQIGNQVKGDEFFLTYFIIHGGYALRIGDIQTASRLFIEAYEYYLTSEFPQRSSLFRTISIKAAESQMALNNFEKAGEILCAITPQMNDRKDRAEYLMFLKVRSMYCFSASQLDDANVEVLDRGYFRKMIDWMNPNWELRQALIEKSISDLDELGSLIEDKEGNHSIVYASHLINKGAYYEVFGNYEDAKNNYIQAKSIIKEFQEIDEDILYKVNLGLSRVGYHLGNKKDFLAELAEIETYSFDKIRNNFPFLSEEEREKFILNQNYGFNLTNALYTLSDSETHSSKIYDNIVAIKGIALSSNIKFRNLLQSSSQSLFNEYLKIQKEKESFQDVSLMDSESLKKKIQIELQEKEFINKVRRTIGTDLVEISENTAEKVIGVLEDDEVAIEIFTVPTSKTFKDSIHYYGVILKKEYKAPKIVKLFSEEELNSALKVTGGFANQINKIYGLQKEKLLSLIWSKLSTEVKGKNRVFLSVSGALHGVSIPSLLIDEPFELVLLSSTKGILNFEEENELHIARASVFGDPNFSSTSSQELEQLRTSYQDSVKVSGNIFERLPFTREEALAISRLLGRDGMTEVEIFLENEASEENLRTLSGRKTNLLHLATHGYFIENQIQNPNRFIELKAQNPLLNSGLILASSSNSDQFNSMKDGVVTALDISKLNFSNTDLVVLSACETGLGIQLGGEGVFGLQRAFKIAGAKSVMVSLWKVPDSQTALLMEEFYKFLSTGLSLENSLRAAQVKIRDQFPEPFYWAGFVLISD